MKVFVTGVYKPYIKKLLAAGWRANKDQISSSLGLKETRRHCGWEMMKDCENIGAAVRSFESATGLDAMDCQDQCGCSVHYFHDGCHIYAGWELGQFLFAKWASTPRKALGMLNS